MIYLDNAATTYPKPDCVYEALNIGNRNAFNAGRGSYKVAREASALKDNVRKKILELNDLKKGEVVYTESATAALNDIIFGLDIKEGDYIYISPFEHNSIIRPLEELRKRYNINISVLPFDKKTWQAEMDNIENQFALHNPKAVFLSQVSNVTGYILPYEEIFEKSLKYNAINVLDSSQGYGVVKINNLENINYIAFAGHKSLYASFGIAGYIKLKSDILKKNIFGGTGSDTLNPNMPEKFPNGYEAGSTNIVGIYGLDASIDWLQKTDIYNCEKDMTAYLISELIKLEKIKVFLPQKYEMIFGVISIGVKGYSADDVGTILDDEFDICVRTGYHCAPLVHDFIGSIEYLGTIRISLSYFTTKEDIDSLISALKTL